MGEIPSFESQLSPDINGIVSSRLRQHLGGHFGQGLGGPHPYGQAPGCSPSRALDHGQVADGQQLLPLP